MAERDRARPVTQRKFEEVVESAPPPPPAPPAGRSEEGPPPAPSEPIPRAPSDREFRARQLKWILERERVSADSPAAGEEAPK